MARDHARLALRIWTDEEFRGLSMAAKLLYIQLFSQQKLSYAGVLDLAVKRWARPHPDLDAGGIRAALAELDGQRFVVVDQDTEEVLIRTYIRNDELYKQPNVLRGALREAFDIESPILRTALAVELRRLPVEVTGPAPAIAANELESGAHVLPPVVKAAMTVRPTGRPSLAGKHQRLDEPSEQDTTEPTESEQDQPQPRPEGSPNPSGSPSPNPSGKPSTKGLGEGSREQETGEPAVTSRGEKVGVPARRRESAHAREDQPAPSSARQSWHAEADRLVRLHSPAQPGRVLQRLVTEVMGLLADEVEPAMIAAGLRIWATKRLAVSFLPELVGEYMRTHLTAASAAKVETDTHAVATFERVRAAAALDDGSPLADAVCGELPAHSTPDELDALLRDAGTRALAAATA